MSELLAKRFKLIPLEEGELEELIIALDTLPEYDKPNYLFENGIVVLNDIHYRFIATRLNSEGFVDVAENADGSLDITACWDSGAGHWSEILDTALRQKDHR